MYDPSDYGTLAHLPLEVRLVIWSYLLPPPSSRASITSRSSELSAAGPPPPQGAACRLSRLAPCLDPDYNPFDPEFPQYDPTDDMWSDPGFYSDHTEYDDTYYPPPFSPSYDYDYQRERERDARSGAMDSVDILCVSPGIYKEVTAELYDRPLGFCIAGSQDYSYVTLLGLPTTKLSLICHTDWSRFRSINIELWAPPAFDHIHLLNMLRALQELVQRLKKSPQPLPLVKIIVCEDENTGLWNSITVGVRWQHPVLYSSFSWVDESRRSTEDVKNTDLAILLSSLRVLPNVIQPVVIVPDACWNDHDVADFYEAVRIDMQDPDTYNKTSQTSNVRQSSLEYCRKVEEEHMRELDDALDEYLGHDRDVFYDQQAECWHKYIAEMDRASHSPLESTDIRRQYASKCGRALTYHDPTHGLDESWNTHFQTRMARRGITLRSHSGLENPNWATETLKYA